MVYVGMHILLKLSKVPMYEFHNYIKTNISPNGDFYHWYWQIGDKIETENVYDNFSKIGIKIKIIILVIILLSQNMTINQTHSFLVKWKIKCLTLLLKNLLD